ncbi:37847_t:CDS:1 [Gigaspora margarita]|uniref:37847_t:CDS:1 n=1 Tax=Gigaspora margarita TaxID=4874 RepID=A0ABN7WNL7_GIGMA|nr:37847_t:CDS:1 [Gigaspora margarita]
MKESLTYLERRFNLFFEFGGSGVNKSVRIPNPNYQPKFCPQTTEFINSLKEKLECPLLPTPQYNITLREKKALHQLINDENIVITQTDKNLGLAIIPYNEYIIAVKNLLSIEEYDEINLTEKEVILLIQEKIFDLLITMSNKIQNYFILPEDNLQLPFFHALPKVHKTPLKWRPIVGMHSAPIKRLSVFLSDILKDWMKELEQNYGNFWTPIKDNYQLIYQVEKIKNQFAHVVTGDFESLYSKFTHDEILSAFDYLNDHAIPIRTYYGFNKPKIRFILSLVIGNNYFKALGKIFKQKRGIAMGTNAAVHIAQLTCFAHELVGIKNGLFNNIFFRRYIDDIIIFYNNFDEKIITNFYPSHHKITWQYNKKGKLANFLDLTFFIENNEIFYKRYSKFPRSAAFVHYKSNHRLSMKKQVVINEVSRLSLICAKKEDFEQEKRSLLSFLETSKGYPFYILNELKFIEWEKRTETLTKINEIKKEKGLPPIILKVPYDDAVFKMKNYSGILKETFEQKMDIKTTQRPILCVTNQPSLVRILARSSTGHPNPNPNLLKND